MNDPVKTMFFLLIGICCINTKCFSSEFPAKQNYTDTIFVGSELGYPPFCFLNEKGEADGFSVDLFRAAAREMGLFTVFKTGPWINLKNELSGGSLDALPLVGRTPQRENIFDFTIPYLVMHGAIVVRNSENNIHSFADLKGKKVAVMRGDNAEEFLQDHNPGAEVHSTLTFKGALAGLSRGKYDAVLIQHLLALRLINENKLDNLQIISESQKIYEQAFSFAVQKGNSELLSLLNEGLSIIVANGTYRRLHAKWFAPPEEFKDRRRAIIIGGDYNYPPYEFLDEDGRPAGYNVELMQAIAEEMGIRIRFKLGPWDKIQEDLKQGRIDVIQGMIYSPFRDEMYDMSPAHTYISYVIASREGMPVLSNIEQLDGENVLVQNHDIMHEFANDMGLKEEIITVESQEEAIRLLAEGENDYALVPRVLLHYFSELNHWDNVTSGKEAIYTAEYCVSVMEGNTDLLAIFNEGLAAIEKTGKYREIYSKWLGVYEDPEFTLRDLLKYIYFILIPLLMFLIASFIWSHSLRKQVNRRTKELQEEIEVRKKTENALRGSRRKYKQLFDSIRDAIMVVDLNRNILDCNSAFIDLFGYSLHSVRDKSTRMLYKDNQQYTEMGKVLEKHKLKPQDKLIKAYFKRKDDTVFPGEINISNLEDDEGKVMGFIGLIRDVTEEQASRELLRKSKEKAEESNRLKSAFLANMSHEIRTPMNGILGFTSLLKDLNLSGDKKEEYIDLIHKSANRLLAIINDILDISKIEAGHVEMSIYKTSVNEIIDENFSLFRKEAENKGLNLERYKQLGDQEVILQTDGVKLNQVISNLLKNAIKFTHSGEVEFGYKYMDNSGLYFYVTDTGIGIDENMKGEIFERFSRAKTNISRDYEGTGLGLSISKAYVEMLGGNLILDSIPGKGSTFSFCLPFSQESLRERQ